ncbi:hypothetical protein L1987_75601 [Smallanthus sonchifolius]|uniref:Uncharacterized protein n=1 Tax=Smallanthus sonchifolius TaxID=185202 RepID=A0ACB9A605_9ASTR|nr:hypothetical protein L1987_75601 [Smallanthus sonchifolius]
MVIFTIFPSWLVTTTLVLSMSCMFLFIILRSNRSVPKLPPSPPKLPIIGNLHQLLGLPRHQALWQLSKQYGPLMQIHIGSKPFIVISSPTMAKHVFKNQDHIFCSRPTYHATKRLTYNYLDTAFSPHDNHWREMRKILVSEFLGPKRASSFNHVLVTEIKSMVHSVSLHPSKAAINLNELLLATVKGLVCKFAFGENYRQQPLKGPSWEVMLGETMDMLTDSLGDFFPWLSPLIDVFSGWNNRVEKCFSNLDAYIETIVAEHQNRTIRGIDTTIVTMVWAMSEITRNAGVMKKLQSEIRNCTGRVEKEHKLDITKMTYLTMMVKETLRLHPPAPLLIPHESLSHCQIGGYDVFPRTTVLINGWAIGRDPETWGENAAEFYPERSCPAMNLTPTVVEFAIASLLYWFDWEVPDEVKNGDLNMMEKEDSLVLRKKLPLYLIPIKHMW